MGLGGRCRSSVWTAAVGRWIVTTGVAAAVVCPAQRHGAAAAVGSTTDIPAPLLETLTAPPMLPNRSSLPNTVEVDLTAEPTRLSLLPGKTSSFFAYNGRVPGPTFEVLEGDRVI